MATGLLAQYQAVNADQTFAQRVEIAMLQAAQNIAAEATSTTNHANRVALAKAASLAPKQYAPLFTEMLAAQAIDTSSTDAAINTMVASVWNTLAGVP